MSFEDFRSPMDHDQDEWNLPEPTMTHLEWTKIFGGVVLDIGRIDDPVDLEYPIWKTSLEIN